MKLSFIGLGIMGGPMALHLASAGHQLTVFNRSAVRVQPLLAAGAQAASTPVEAARGAEIVHLCLKNPDAVRDVVFEQGLLASLQPGQTLIDHGTSGVAQARQIGQAAAGRGVHFMDAPISGGVEGARAGTLAIMAGGEAAVFERVEPVLEAMGTTVRHVGPVGSGQALKLANQLLVIVQQLAAAEAFAFARKAGVDGETFGEIVLNAWGRSYMLERSLPGFLSGDFAPGRASLTTLMKDARLLADSAWDLDLNIPLSEAATELMAAAIEQGYGDEDIAAALKLYLED